MKLYRFEATPTVQQQGAVKWELCYIRSAVHYPECGDGTPARPYPNVSVPMGAGEQPFQFTIKGDTGIVFAPDPPQSGPVPPNAPGPIWINKKGQPNKPGTHHEITDIAVGGGKKVLTFRDINDEAITLKYQLNFVDAQGNPVTPLDPDITNGGKGFIGAETSLLLAAALIAALIAGAVASVVANRAMKKP